MKKLFLLFCIPLSFASFSQEKEKPEAIVWKVVYIDQGNSEGEIVFTANIADKFHLYSQKPSEAIPVPTSFTITPNADYQAVDKVSETNAHEVYEEMFGAKVFVFEKEAVFKQKIKRRTGKAFMIDTYVEYITCNDVMCFPPKTLQFFVTVPEARPGTQK